MHVVAILNVDLVPVEQRDAGDARVRRRIIVIGSMRVIVTVRQRRVGILQPYWIELHGFVQGRMRLFWWRFCAQVLLALQMAS